MESEIQDELGLASRYLYQRELEAPERFRAIQTHRATISILTRLEHFVHELESTGMIDEVDAEILQVICQNSAVPCLAKPPAGKWSIHRRMDVAELKGGGRGCRRTFNRIAQLRCSDNT